MTFYAGCWREDGVDLVRAALIRIFGNDWKPSIEDTTLRFLSATSTLPQVPIETPDPYLINVANGMYDIEFGALAPHDPTFFSRNQIPVAYDPDAECPLFDSWLAEVLRPDQIPVMWEVIGYTLFPRNHLHRAVLLHGSTGRNGKSTLLKVLSALVGKENVSNVSFSTLTNPSTGRFALEQLRGKLLNSAGEQDAGKMPTALLKQLISGDPLQADRKNKAFISFTPHALQVVATNSNITSNDHSEALADRFVIFEFERTFYGVEDPTLGDRLTAPAELQGILARALDALDRLLERGRFDLSQEMLDDRNEYAAAMGGSVREWLHAYTVPEPDGRIEKPQAWQAYQDACLLDNVRTTVTKNQFYRALEGMSHIKEVRVKGTRYFKGIVLNDEAVAPSEFV
jgi:P4 family phage/plasmid primase-like protien